MWACCWCRRIRSTSGSKSELRHNNSNRLTRRSVCPALCCLPITSSVINETDPPVQQGGTHTVSASSSCGRRRIISYFPLPSKLLKQAEPSTSQLLSPKAEFTARPLLRQQIPARCRSLRLLSWLFSFFFGPKGAKD